MRTELDDAAPQPDVRRTFLSWRRRVIPRPWVTGIPVALASLLLVLPAVSIPVASPGGSQYQAFYAPPAPRSPGKPGDLIRSEPSRLVLELSGQLGAYVATGTRNHVPQ
jgi:triacylglycerol lipase